MKLKFLVSLALFLDSAFAHFAVLIPSNSSVESKEKANLTLTYKFMHPFLGDMMNMQTPSVAGVFANGEREIFKNLTPASQGNFSYFKTDFKVNKPAVYQFYADFAPYFEPSENKFIRHIVKTVVNGYGYGEGWDEPIGLQAEIVPLTRPYGLYKGNIFTGRVLTDGKPAKNVVVEVEYYNEKGVKAPSEDHVTQEVKTNELGEFSFVTPLAGWWGIAALTQGGKIKKDGKDYDVELGAVLWIEAKDYE